MQQVTVPPTAAPHGDPLDQTSVPERDRPRRPADALGSDELGLLVGALYDVANHARRASNGDPIEPAGMRVLVWVKALKSARPSELAQGLKLDLSTVSRHLRTLAASGLVVTKPDAEDGRAQRVAITPAGLDAIAAVVENRRALIGSAMESWPAADRTRLTELLRRLAEDLDRVNE